MEWMSTVAVAEVASKARRPPVDGPMAGSTARLPTLGRQASPARGEVYSRIPNALATLAFVKAQLGAMDFAAPSVRGDAAYARCGRRAARRLLSQRPCEKSLSLTDALDFDRDRIQRRSDILAPGRLSEQAFQIRLGA